MSQAWKTTLAVAARLAVLAPLVGGLAASDVRADCYSQIDPVYLQTDPQTLMQATTAAEAAALRTAIIDHLWPQSGFPSGTPTVMQDVIVAPGVVPSGLPNVLRVDRYVVTMPLGFVSSAYHFHPVVGNGRLVMLHQGHVADAIGNGIGDTLAFLLEQGFSVVTFLMPGLGSNVGPTRQHDELPQYASATFNPMSLFVEPVATVLNHVDASYAYSDVTMIGHSGGGWTTTLHAAIDPRVRSSFPVAGSLPLYLTAPPCSVGRDYEQSSPALYVDTASYLDLYVLGSLGAGRRQLQMLRQYDGCCFWGITYRTYEGSVAGRVAQLAAGPDGGEFGVFLDPASWGAHALSAYPQAEIMRQLGTRVWTVDSQYEWPTNTKRGTWEQIIGVGYDDIIRRTDTGSGWERIGFEFPSLIPGLYRVATTWVAEPALGTDVTYTVDNGSVSQDVVVDQTAAPDDFVYQQTSWETLALVEVSGEALEVELTGVANGAVVADAVHAEWLQPVDVDGDGVLDHQDNCLASDNPGQRDTDQDGYGNSCDADYTNDGIVAAGDFGVLGGSFGSTIGEPRYEPDADVTGNGSVGSDAFGLFLSSFGGRPGRSGLACAGAAPCPAP